MINTKKQYVKTKRWIKKMSRSKRWEFVYAYGPKIFNGGLEAVRNRNGEFGYVDIDGNAIIPFQWHWAYSFNEGLAVVIDNNGLNGVIDQSGKIVVPCQYQNISTFIDGKAEVKTLMGEHFFIDRAGNIIQRFDTNNNNTI